LDNADLLPLKEKIGAIDTLVTQFSYASWWGNKDDDAVWKAAAAEQLEKIRREVEVFKPEFVLLSASYVFFDHVENWYMNQWTNTVHDAFAYVSRFPGVMPIVLYPGDRWEVGSPHDSSSALVRYAADRARVMTRCPEKRSKSVDAAKLAGNARDFVRRLRKRNGLLLLLRVPATRVHVTDHAKIYLLSLSGLTEADDGPADVALSSAALLYCLRNDWGAKLCRSRNASKSPKMQIGIGSLGGLVLRVRIAMGSTMISDITQKSSRGPFWASNLD